MQVKIVVHEAEEGGFWAEVPALPGCASQARPWMSSLPTFGKRFKPGWKQSLLLRGTTSVAKAEEWSS